MTDAPTHLAPPVVTPVPAPPSGPGDPTVAVQVPSGGSRGWIGILALCVAVALLAGATAVLFVRVGDAQDRADEAVTIAASQDALASRIDSVDASLASLESAGATTADDVRTARDQVASLRRCVNAALDSIAQGSQSGKPASITKC